MKKTARLFIAMAFLSAFLSGCAGVTKEINLLASARVDKETNLLASLGFAEETKTICPECGVAFATDERIEKYYQENFGGGFK